MLLQMVKVRKWVAENNKNAVGLATQGRSRKKFY